MGFRVGKGFRVQGSGFRVGKGFRVQGLGLGMGSGFRVGKGFRFEGSGPRVGKLQSNNIQNQTPENLQRTWKPSSYWAYTGW